MPLLAKDSGGSNVATIPNGMHHGICYGVVDIGTQPSKNPAYPARRKVLVLFELPAVRGDFQRDGKTVNLPRALSVRYTLSLNTKGNLRPALESWRGRPFTDEELAGFDVGKLIGANGLLNVVQETTAGKTYANIKAITPLVSGMAKKAPENQTLFFSLDDATADFRTAPNMPDWIKGLILGSEEVQRQAAEAGQHGPTEAQMNNTAGAGEEDVPF